MEEEFVERWGMSAMSSVWRMGEGFVEWWGELAMSSDWGMSNLRCPPYTQGELLVEALCLSCMTCCYRGSRICMVTHVLEEGG